MNPHQTFIHLNLTTCLCVKFIYWLFFQFFPSSPSPLVILSLVNSYNVHKFNWIFISWWKAFQLLQRHIGINLYQYQWIMSSLCVWLCATVPFLSVTLCTAVCSHAANQCQRAHDHDANILIHSCSLAPLLAHKVQQVCEYSAYLNSCWTDWIFDLMVVLSWMKCEIVELHQWGKQHVCTIVQ